MKRTVMLALLAALAVVRPAAAQQPHPSRSPEASHAGHADFGQYLFPPELIMQQQRNIGLTTEQRAMITTAVRDLQSRVLDLQWKMEDEAGKIGDQLKSATVDETAVLAQVDKVLGIERDVKRAHLAMLIRLKNALTAEQQAKLTAAKSEMPKGPAPR